MISRQTTKIATLLAILSIAGFFIYQSTAGTMKIITTGSSTVKVNMPDTNSLTSGLVGYWTFDGQDTNWTSATAGTTADKSPGGTNTGTLINMSQTTSPVPGVNGQALSFDGTNDYINAGNGSGLDLTGSMTISAWVYSKDSDDGNIVLKHSMDCSAGFGGDPYKFFINGSNKLTNTLEENNTCIASSNISTDSINLNQWQHIVFTRTSSQETFYINGTQDSGGWQSYSSVEGNQDEVVFGSGFNGYIDEVRIYNRALSAAEITELYQQGQIKINTSQAGKLTNGLVGHWTFDGPDTNWGTNTTNDRSGNGNNGTMTNMSTTTSPVPGVNGHALNFDGTDDYITVPYSAAIDVRDGNIPHTVSMWFKLDTLPSVKGAYEVLLSQADGTGAGRSWLMMSTGAGSGYAANEIIGVGGSAVGVGSNIIPVINTWYFVVLQYSGTVLTIFVDGAQGDSLTTSLDEGATGAFRMGIAKTATSYLDGSIDEVRFYNRALSAAEILELYNAGR